MGEALSFYFLASIITVLSISVITIRKPVVAVSLLVFNLFFLAGIYALLGADFVAVIQIIIYAGAILVLFMFVIMILDPDEEKKLPHTFFKRLTLFGLIFLGFVGFVFKMFRFKAEPLSEASIALTQDNTYELGIKLFETYLWPFELASILILLAIVASILISRKPTPLKKT